MFNSIPLSSGNRPQILFISGRISLYVCQTLQIAQWKLFNISLTLIQPHRRWYGAIKMGLHTNLLAATGGRWPISELHFHQKGKNRNNSNHNKSKRWNIELICNAAFVVLLLLRLESCNMSHPTFLEPLASSAHPCSHQKSLGHLWHPLGHEISFLLSFIREPFTDGFFALSRESSHHLKMCCIKTNCFTSTGKKYLQSLVAPMCKKNSGKFNKHCNFNTHFSCFLTRVPL